MYDRVGARAVVEWLTDLVHRRQYLGDSQESP